MTAELPAQLASRPATHPVTGWLAGVSVRPMACQAWALTGLANDAVPNSCEVQVEPVASDHTWDDRGIVAAAAGVGRVPTVVICAVTPPCIR